MNAPGTGPRGTGPRGTGPRGTGPLGTGWGGSGWGTTGLGGTGPGRSATERVLVVGGTVVGVLGGVGTGVIEAMYAPLYWGGVRSPLSPLLALVGNAALVWFTYQVTRSRGLALLPGAAWLVVMAIAVGGPGSGIAKGNLFLTSNNWMGLVMLGAGGLSWLAAAFLLVVPPGTLRRRPGMPAVGGGGGSTGKGSRATDVPGSARSGRNGPGSPPSRA